MLVEMGSVTVLYSYFDDTFSKIKADKKTLYQIANNLSAGIKFGQFHTCFDGINDEPGWWIIYDKEITNLTK